jgi:predicted nucleic acid-binding protein
LLLAECTSVLNENAYRKEVLAEHARALVEVATRMPIRPVEAPKSYHRAFDSACSIGHPKAYDALYLAVAEIEDAELLTMDRGMSEAAACLGIRATLVR